MKNKKTIKISPRVIISNPAVTTNELEKALDFSKRRKPSEKYKFLNVVLSLWPGAIVISWSVAHVGFGELTYSLQNGKLQTDTEGMNDEFVRQLQSEVVKRHKSKKLQITVGDDILKKLFERFASELTARNKK